MRKLKRLIQSILITPHYLFYKFVKGRQVYVRWNTSDVNVYYHTLVQKEYKFPFTIDPKFIIDAGANIGLAALVFNRRYPEARIICIEPESGNAAILKKNIRGKDSIQFLHKGLWSKSTFLKIIDINQSNWAFITEEVADTEAYDVDAISVNELLDVSPEGVIDILKVDIEGSERTLFKENLEWLPNTKLIIIELHSDEIRKRCEKVLMEHGFTHFYANGENDYYANQAYFDEDNCIFS